MSEKILQVKNLNVSFPTSMEHFHAVKNVSFDLYRGETLSVIGESGSKSYKVLVSKGRMSKLAVKHEDLVPTDGNHSN